MKTLRRLCALSAVGLILTAPTAQALEAGDWLVRFGLSTVDPKSSNSPLVSVDAGTSASVTLSYMYTDNVSIELLAAYPFEHDIDLVGGDKVADTKHLPPTLSLNYHFTTASAFKPYIGVGVNYTTFFSESTTGALAGTDLSLDDSWGLAGQIGMDYEVNDRWSVNLAARYIDIETDAKLDGVPLGTVEIDPWVFSVQAGYRF